MVARAAKKAVRQSQVPSPATPPTSTISDMSDSAKEMTSEYDAILHSLFEPGMMDVSTMSSNHTDPPDWSPILRSENDLSAQSGTGSDLCSEMVDVQREGRQTAHPRSEIPSQSNMVPVVQLQMAGITPRQAHDSEDCICVLLRLISRLHLPDPSCANTECSKQQQHSTQLEHCSSFSSASSTLSSNALDTILLIIRESMHALESALSCNCSHDNSLMAFCNVLTEKIIWWYRRIIETRETSGIAHSECGRANPTTMSLGQYTLQPEQQQIIVQCIILIDMESRLLPILARLRNVSTAESGNSADDLIVRCNASSLQ